MTDERKWIDAPDVKTPGPDDAPSDPVETEPESETAPDDTEEGKKP